MEDLPRHGDLLAPFLQIILIDTDLINPQDTLANGTSQVDQGNLKVLCDVKPRSLQVIDVFLEVSPTTYDMAS